MIAFASSLDQGGPIAKSAEDLALLLNVMAGFDARDSTSVERAREDYARDLEKPLAGLRIGVPQEEFCAGGGRPPAPAPPRAPPPPPRPSPPPAPPGTGKTTPQHPSPPHT